MPRQPTNSTRPLLVGSIVVAVVATLLAIAVGFATNVLSVLVDQQWVRGHRGLVLAGFGTVAAVSIFVAAVQARRAHQAAAPAPQAQTPTGQQLGQSTSVSHSQVGAMVTIETAHGPVTVGAPPAPIPPPTPSDAAGTSNLPPPNPDFTGRRQLLDRLWRTLGSGPTAVVAAHGLGGVGKTQLALEYAHQHRDRGDYDLVWWVPAETPLSVAASLTLLAPVLGLAVAADQEATVATVLAELGRRERWLLVFDNAEDPQHLRRYLPPGRGGHVLVTSRNPAWSGIARPLDVDVLSPDEAIELLTGSSGDADRQAAAQVAEALGWLPLALAQAAAYTQQIPGLGLAGYLDRYHHAHAELLARSQPTDYPATVATTWRLNLDQVARSVPAAVALLRLCAFLEPETPIPLDLVANADPQQLPAELARVARDPLALDATAAALYRYSLVSPAQGGIRVHRLVQAVTRSQLTDQQTAELVTQAARLLLAAFPNPPEDPRDWPRAALLLPHALAAARHAEAWPSAHRPTSALLNQAGIYLIRRAELGAARQTLERALRMSVATYGPDHPEVAATLTNLGIVLRDLGELAAARQTLERALRMKEAAYGPDHPEVAITLGNLGVVLEQLGELAAARQTLERVLRLFQATYGPEHPQVAATLTNLGNVLFELGELAAARQTLERALRGLEAAYGPDDPQVAMTMGNLGNVLRELGALAAAREIQERVLRIEEATYGPDHPEVAATLTNLGIVLRDLGELAAARQTLERALRIEEAAYERDHPQVAITLGNLGNVLRDLGELAAARQTLERALRSFQAAYGPDHPHVQQTQRILDNLSRG